MKPMTNNTKLTPRFCLRAALMAAALATTGAAAPALAAFSGQYDSSGWTTTLTGTPPGGGWPAGVDTTAAPDAITIVGGDEVWPGGTDCWDDNLANPRKGCAVLYTIVTSREYPPEDLEAGHGLVCLAPRSTRSQSGRPFRHGRDVRVQTSLRSSHWGTG